MNSNRKLKSFFEDNNSRLFGYLMKLSGNREDAEDLYQDCFIKYARTYPDRQSIPLLYSVAKSVFIDQKRKHRNFCELTGSEPVYSGSPEDHLLESRRKNEIISKLALLSEEDRELLALSSDKGLKYSEMAEVTGMSLANVKTRIHRARLKLRELLTESDI
jgi:RNA polymerase sigma-70 factor (ECF subfamily)